jgi:hypothetical protein
MHRFVWVAAVTLFLAAVIAKLTGLVGDSEAFAVSFRGGGDYFGYMGGFFGYVTATAIEYGLMFAG